MLDTIRQLTRTLKLKDLIISNFIPEETARSLERRAAYVEEDDAWTIPVRYTKTSLPLPLFMRDA